jgi:hypothetical protein
MAPTRHDDIDEVHARISRLEAAVFGSADSKPAFQARSFSGPSGGVRLLLEQGFFVTKRSLADVRAALDKAGYQYGAAQVQTALNRMAVRNGPLVTHVEGGRKHYARRK